MKTYLHNQKYAECQLVTAINSAIMLGQPFIGPETSEYERLVDLVGARYGSAISIQKAWDYLRLDSELLPSEFRVLSHYKEDPFEVGVWTEKHGYHSVMVRKDLAKEDGVIVHNIAEEDEGNGIRMQWEGFNTLVHRKKNVGNSGGMFRRFFIKEMFLDP